MPNISKLTIIKFLELVVVCVLVGLHYHSFGAGDAHAAMLIMGTFVGYLIILIGLVLCGLLGSPAGQKLDLYFSIVGFVLFIVAGALTIDYFKDGYHGSTRDTGLAKGSIALFEGVLFLIDAILTYRGGE